jgi:hypothetical protein
MRCAINERPFFISIHVRRRVMRRLDGSDFQTAFQIYKTLGVHAHALKTAALRGEIRTRPGEDNKSGVLYHSGDARKWAESRSDEERERFAATVARFARNGADAGQAATPRPLTIARGARGAHAVAS